MPAPAPVVGVEFTAVSIANGSGGMTTLFVTVINAAGRFTLRLVNTGTQPAALLITKAGGTTFPFVCDPGSRVLITQQDSQAMGMTWAEVAAKFSIQGGAR